ncbi:hypothetical protein BU14_0031s0045 [Porphyra umbilicalis]|uniref:Mediator of RNA polymerase II transcription subunit 8 n=1 Tax=Porphyra umbilicalis TaxID=2786 RepID=A0A1X6PJK6_PORUM|nr:hypothetical protein BU14_0031s0045 [Porphyra umbilicalis]|eukprot:OSX80873.1 hypothetical protein BU14_0031s0045 [Porphyra umbilicalis]
MPPFPPGPAGVAPLGGALPGAAPGPARPPSTAVFGSKVDSALVSLRLRALELNGRLVELLNSVVALRDGVGTGRDDAWPAFLAAFDTIAKLFTALTADLSRASTEAGLAHYVLLPAPASCEATSETPMASLARTKLPPDVEDDAAALAAAAAREMGAAGTRGAAAQARALAAHVAVYNTFVEGAVDRFAAAREDLSVPRAPPPPDRRGGGGGGGGEAVLLAVERGIGL